MLVLVLAILISAKISAEECQKRDYGNGGHVCVCNSTFCDTIVPPNHVEPPSYLIYISNKAGLRFQKSQGIFAETNEIFDNQIYISSNQEYQEIFGFGGAFTDATGINIKSLDEQAQDKLLNSYFSDSGIEYSLCRVPIGGTDFSERGYSYDDGNVDKKLINFKLADEDFQYKIPLIKKAQSLNNKLRLFTSVWTAPKWMKTNGKYNGFGFIKEDMYQTWAEYFVKFFDKYKEQGIEFWGMSTGNEPSLALTYFSNINSVAWTPDSLSKWIKNNLGPTIRNSSYSNLKIMTIDDQRFFLPWFVNSMFKDKITRDYVDGIAVHWYYDFLFPASLLKDTHQNFPEKFLLATEACHGDKPFQTRVKLGSWDRGESYAEDIIQDLTNWVSGWVDWNMALNLQGGPTYINNFVDSPILVNSTSGEFYKQPMFYALGHFSKFVPRGSIRLGTTFNCQTPIVAFRKPDNGTVVVLLNKKDEVIQVALVDDRRGTTQINLTAKSITTILYW